MQILLTNDDGIGAPGLGALARELARWGRVVVIAPESARSGCSHQVNTAHPIRVRKLDGDRYATDGTPADCVRLGLSCLAPDANWVVAGINAGGNLGVDVYLSGTVAAVREGALFGKYAIAFSQYRRQGIPSAVNS
jgi:5'-nucleotidase